MGTSAILHRLISQSLFLVGIEAYDQRFIRAPESDLVTCGYTPVAIVSAMAVWVFMFACLVGICWMKFASGHDYAKYYALLGEAKCFGIDRLCHRYLRCGVLPLFYDAQRGHDFGLYAALLNEASYFGVTKLESYSKSREYLDKVKVTQWIEEVEDACENKYNPAIRHYSGVFCSALGDGEGLQVSTRYCLPLWATVQMWQQPVQESPG
ncbi:hypothetical protein BJY01DRAFT_242599 [Aspergillus pseudoustus]|uniref:Uncharacterized protein n=1 Tax=Aspergillus pseudoustus TaxID=1810923 RepID=A0ABR4KY41_9EURO